jgi:hypothetical protein
MCEFMGLANSQVKFYQQDRCLARAVRADSGLRYRRGLNWSFPDLRDSQQRSLDPRTMAPAPVQPKSRNDNP